MSLYFCATDSQEVPMARFQTQRDFQNVNWGIGSRLLRSLYVRLCWRPNRWENKRVCVFQPWGTRGKKKKTKYNRLKWLNTVINIIPLFRRDVGSNHTSSVDISDSISMVKDAQYICDVQRFTAWPRWQQSTAKCRVWCSSTRGTSVAIFALHSPVITLWWNHYRRAWNRLLKGLDEPSRPTTQMKRLSSPRQRQSRNLIAPFLLRISA